MTEQVQITIVGTGCIGTSIGLALHQNTQDLLVVGHDKDSNNAGKARKLKAIDKTDWNLINACEDADLILLAIPITGIEDTLKAIAPYLKEGCVITDTASLKQPVVGWAEELLPDTVSFVGGNPLVTSTGSGPEAAEANLFEDNLYCIAPAANAHPDAVSLVSSLVSLLGSQPYYLDAAEHDGLMAGAAHLPLVLALALTHCTTYEAGWREMRKLAGTGFDTISSLVGEDPGALADVLLANRDHVVHWLDAYVNELKSLRDLIAGEETEALVQISERSVAARQQWLQDQRNRFSETPQMPEIERHGLLRTFLPGRLIDRGRRPEDSGKR